MKLCYPLTTPECGVKIMGMSGGFEESLAVLASIGYDGVELMTRHPSHELAVETLRLCKKYKIEPAVVGVTPVAAQDRLFLASPDASVREAAFERAREVITFAAELSVPFCIGSFRGRIEGVGNSIDDAERTFASVADLCESAGIAFLVEPQSVSNSNYINTFAQARAFRKDAGIRNTKFIFDMFHEDINEEDVVKAAANNVGDIGLVHCSGRKRLPPGCDDMPCERISAALRAGGYSGWYSTEVKQEPDSKTAAERSFIFLNSVREKIGRETQ